MVAECQKEPGFSRKDPNDKETNTRLPPLRSSLLPSSVGPARQLQVFSIRQEWEKKLDFDDQGCQAGSAGQAVCSGIPGGSHQNSSSCTVARP